MDKDWAEAEGILSRAYDLIEENHSMVFVTERGLKQAISEALRKVRREAIESCAVIAEDAYIQSYDKDGNKTFLVASMEPREIAKAIRDSEGKV